jgi:hypothetical protein
MQTRKREAEIHDFASKRKPAALTSLFPKAINEIIEEYIREWEGFFIGDFSIKGECLSQILDSSNIILSTEDSKSVIFDIGSGCRYTIDIRCPYVKNLRELIDISDGMIYHIVFDVSTGCVLSKTKLFDDVNEEFIFCFLFGDDQRYAAGRVAYDFSFIWVHDFKTNQSQKLECKSFRYNLFCKVRWVTFWVPDPDCIYVNELNPESHSSRFFILSVPEHRQFAWTIDDKAHLLVCGENGVIWIYDLKTLDKQIYQICWRQNVVIFDEPKHDNERCTIMRIFQLFDGQYLVWLYVDRNTSSFYQIVTLNFFEKTCHCHDFPSSLAPHGVLGDKVVFSKQQRKTGNRIAIFA